MYSRSLDDGVLTFGHEGLLYKNSFVMYDKETGSLWIHTTGQAVRGKLKGRRLDFLPSVVMPWSSWKERYPQTTILLGPQARGFMGTFGLQQSPHRYGISVGQGAATKLYPVPGLSTGHLINDEWGGKAIVVILDPETMAARAYERGDLRFQWQKGRLTDDRGGTWDQLSGRSDDGPRQLTPLPAIPWLIERWKGFYPEGSVHGP